MLHSGCTPVQVNETVTVCTVTLLELSFMLLCPGPTSVFSQMVLDMVWQLALIASITVPSLDATNLIDRRVGELGGMIVARKHQLSLELHNGLWRYLFD